jgi:hypothetical protein
MLRFSKEVGDVKFYLTSLKLDGEEVRFRQAWLTWQKTGSSPEWDGIVVGNDAPNGGRLDGELVLIAQTPDGSRLDGIARLERRDVLSGDLELNGVGPLFVDGRKMV